jgi:hypothetical protein
MELDPTEWQLVSDPFESSRLYRSITPLISEEGAGTVQLLIAEKPNKPSDLLACHDFKSLGIFDAEIRLLHGEEVLTLGSCTRLGEIDTEGFWEPPIFKQPLILTPAARIFLRPPMKEVHYRLKHDFHTHRGTVQPSGVEALRRAIEIISA